MTCQKFHVLMELGLAHKECHWVFEFVGMTVQLMDAKGKMVSPKYAVDTVQEAHDLSYLPLLEDDCQ